MACRQNHSSGDADLGSPIWFCVEKKLNHYGYVPGAPRRESDALPDPVCNEAKVIQRWGEKMGGKFWYAKKVCSESPRMRYRVEKLYQVTHQKPIGNQRGISLGFARGLIAENLGYAVDWATYAARQCRRGNKPFHSIEDLKLKTRLENGGWPSNEVFLEDETLFEGSPDDWEVNCKVEHHNPQLVNGYNLKAALPTVPEDEVAPPMYTKGQNFRVTLERESLTASSESESKEENYSGDDKHNAVEEEKVSMWQGESSRARSLKGTPSHKWDGCPLSPDVSVGFPEGARGIEDDSDEENATKYIRSRHDIEEGVNERTSGSGLERKLTYVTETHDRTTSEDPPADTDMFLEVYGAVCVEMDNEASRQGFESFTADKKLGYLRDSEIKYERQWRKRRAEKYARLQWIASKRRIIHCLKSCQTRSRTDVSGSPGEQSISDDIDMYERPGAVSCNYARYERGAVSASTQEDHLQVSGGATHQPQMNSVNEEVFGFPLSTTTMSPLRFANRPLVIPEDVGNHSTGSKEKSSVWEDRTNRIIIPDSDTE
ncbi:hypothetical protein KC19_VG079200 [Ceratodon purpureus]|uniref:Uncharacterized protein n=1 Tax=Ceratodon purpureus TaxID=3225 RepID=A0A8T0HN48_CERPU|nr:hypothetical protein KC19_VG079200 [Ceratodon purpureus]KAG0572249.1 hypothetical protein KC19_VG079200 [Ceratodon purpureus]